MLIHTSKGNWAIHTLLSFKLSSKINTLHHTEGSKEQNIETTLKESKDVKRNSNKKEKPLQ